MRRDYLFWGSVLILLGGLLFLNAAGIPLPGGVHAMQLFWPAVLILLGGWIILNSFWRGGIEAGSLAIDLQGAQRASLRLNYGGGRMKLAAGAPAGQVLLGTTSGRVKREANLSGDLLDVRLELTPDWLPPFGGGGEAEWDLRLNRDLPLTLRIDSGAAQSEFDLRDLRVTDLEFHTGASKTDLILPAAAGLTTVKVELGAASLDVLVPQGVAARIRVEAGAAAINVDTDRFPYKDGVYESADYASAQNRVEVTIQAGAGKVAVR